MKLVHIVEASATGTLTMVVLLANAQNSIGHHVSVIYSVRPETPENIEDLFEEGVSLIRIGMLGGLERVSSLFRLRKTLQAIGPGVVFMHSSFAGFLGRLSCLFTLHRTLFLYIPHCISFMRKDVGTIKKTLFIVFEWIAALKKADYVACSESEQKVIRSAVPFRPCHMVENALDFTNIPKLFKTDLCERSKIVITVGQIRAQKGPNVFASIAREIKKEDPEVDFVWVGDGDPVMRRELEAAGVRVIGWIPKNQVWQYLSVSRLYLSTALWEGMPVSLIEASCALLPVVASSCAGNVDIVSHDKTGWLFRTPAEAVRHIQNSLNDTAHSASMARAAFDIAQQRFTMERYIHEMEALSLTSTR